MLNEVKHLGCAHIPNSVKSIEYEDLIWLTIIKL